MKRNISKHSQKALLWHFISVLHTARPAEITQVLYFTDAVCVHARPVGGSGSLSQGPLSLTAVHRWELASTEGADGQLHLLPGEGKQKETSRDVKASGGIPGSFHP